MVTFDGDAFGGFNTRLKIMPVIVATLYELCNLLFTLENNGEVRFVLGLFNSPV